jgi:uncharacterized membrane protein
MFLPPAKYELFLKVVTWQAVSIACNFSASLAFTGKLAESAGIALATGTALMLLQWLFEVFWDETIRERIRNAVSKQ